MNSFLNIFAWVKNNKRLKASRARTIENHAKMILSWLVEKWYHTYDDINGITTRESGDIIFLMLLPFGIQL